MSFTAGYEAVLAYKPEATSLTGYGVLTNDLALPSTPTNPIIIGYANVPGLKTERGSKKGFGIGSPFSLYNGKGTRRYEVTVDAPLTGKEPLTHFLRGSGGYKDLADLCLYVGNSGIVGGGHTRVIRMAKCNTFTLAFTEGSAQEVRLQATLMGLFEQASSAITPTEEQLAVEGSPYFWNTVINAKVTNKTGRADVELRDVISSLNITGSHNLKQRGFRPGTDDTKPLDLTHYSIIPGKFVGTATLGLHERLDTALRDATDNATVWGDIDVVLQQPDKYLKVTLHNCILNPDSQNAGDDGDAPIAYGCDILYSKISVTDVEPEPEEG